MDLGLAGKVAVVTGASRGIGLATARGFAAEGCRLVLCARTPENLAAAAESIRSEVGAQVEIEAIPLDITTDDGPRRLIDAAVARFGRVDIVVNNVGGSSPGRFDEIDADAFQTALDRNFLPAVRTSHAALPHLSAGSCIVHVASIWGREAGGSITYNTSKAALISLAKGMGQQLAPRGIRVVSIAPGSVLHPGGTWEKRLQADPEGITAFMQREIPSGRFGTAEEIAHVIVFAASPRASWVTATCLVVDGGQSRAF